MDIGGFDIVFTNMLVKDLFILVLCFSETINRSLWLLRMIKVGRFSAYYCLLCRNFTLRFKKRLLVETFSLPKTDKQISWNCHLLQDIPIHLGCLFVHFEELSISRAWINNPVSGTVSASVPWVGAAPGVSRPPPAGTTPQSHRRIFRIKDDFCKRICK